MNVICEVPLPVLQVRGHSVTGERYYFKPYNAVGEFNFIPVSVNGMILTNTEHLRVIMMMMVVMM